MRYPRYHMRDLNGAKIDHIMAFDVSAGRGRPKSVFELGVFLTAVALYLVALAVSA